MAIESMRATAMPTAIGRTIPCTMDQKIGLMLLNPVTATHSITRAMTGALTAAV
ncbi:hypothetical protein ACIQ7D_01925 [Streptomyces sp. NPDC096310]|uniref:hypothetical protein n=1 Tax=Streptomyces sp. NPDC096310 TaxID=3366082 RepID=UPI00381B64A0